MYKVVYQKKHWYGWRDVTNSNSREWYMPTLELACQTANQLNESKIFTRGLYRYGIKKVRV